MSCDQIPSLPGKTRRQMPWVCPGRGDVEASISLVHKAKQVVRKSAKNGLMRDCNPFRDKLWFSYCERNMITEYQELSDCQRDITGHLKMLKMRGDDVLSMVA